MRSTPWLDGVTTFDGGDAAAAVKAALGALTSTVRVGLDAAIRAAAVRVAAEHRSPDARPRVRG